MQPFIGRSVEAGDILDVNPWGRMGMAAGGVILKCGSFCATKFADTLIKTLACKKEAKLSLEIALVTWCRMKRFRTRSVMKHYSYGLNPPCMTHTRK